MTQLVHGSATTTARLRALFQASSEPTAVLARRSGVTSKTVRKWRQRTAIGDRLMGPYMRRSSCLPELEEAAVVASRVQMHLPLDDVFIAIPSSMPGQTRSTLYRCLQLHGVSPLPRAQAPPR